MARGRRDIRRAAPEAEECICYGVPAFRLHGRFLAALGAAARHCSFYPGASLHQFTGLLQDYETSKGTIRFQPGRPLPATLVRKLAQARIADGGMAGKPLRKGRSSAAARRR